MSINRLKLSDLIQEKKYGFSIDGIKINGRFGNSVSSAGDFNGDGVDDLMVGSESDEAYVIYGENGLYSVNLNALNGDNGFVVKGVSGDKLGYSLSSAGDFNGDGVDDIIVGAYEGTPPGFRGEAGKVYILYGNVTYPSPFDVNTLNSTTGFVINGISQRDNTGFSVSSAGDVNGDGIDDVVIGAYQADSISKQDAGKGFIIYGSKNHDSTLELKDLDSSKGVEIINSLFFRLGTSVSSAGDFNDDGIDDVIIGSQGYGKACVVYGSKNLKSPIYTNDLNGNNGIIIDEMTSRNNDFGFSVSSAGDFNGDKISDVIIGVPKAQDGVNNQGDVHIVYGKNNYTSYLKETSYKEKILDVSLNYQNGELRHQNYSLYIRGDQSEGGNFGNSISKIGDINNDGYDDVLIGARAGNQANSGDSWTGLVYLLLGSSNHDSDPAPLNARDWNNNLGFIIEGVDQKGYFGWSVSSAGDVNGDGKTDLIIGAPRASAGGKYSAGKVYIIDGTKIANEYLTTSTTIATTTAATTTTINHALTEGHNDDFPKDSTSNELSTTNTIGTGTTPDNNISTTSSSDEDIPITSSGFSIEPSCVVLLGLYFASF